MASLNPPSLGGNVITDYQEAVPGSVKLFALDHIPDVAASVDFGAQIVFTNLVGSRAALAAAGDYFIDPVGKVFTYLSTDPGGHVATYDYTSIQTNYSGSSLNVIPDPSQTDLRCALTPVSGGYQVDLPTVTDSGSESYGQQLQLPDALSYLADSEEVPSGFMYLWDHVDNAIVEGLTYYKEPATLASFVAKGATLDNSVSTRYSVITTGTPLTKLIEYIRDYIISHNHNDNLSQFLDHEELLGTDVTITHGTTSDIVGKDDAQILTNKTLTDPIFTDESPSPDTDLIVQAYDGEIRFLKPVTFDVRKLSLDSLYDFLTGKSSDSVDNIHADPSPTANYLLALDGSAKFPNSVLYTGSGNGIDADTLDGQHAPAGTIIGTSDTQTLTNKRLDLPKINSATTTDITSEDLETLSDGSNADALHAHSGTASLNWGSLQLTGWLNNWDQLLNSAVGIGKVVVGLYSIHNNGVEDRLFKFYYRTVTI